MEAVPKVGGGQPPRAADMVPLRRFAIFGAALSLCFGKVLYDLVLFASDSELYSHILLIPFVSAFLVWIRRRQCPSAFRASRGLACIALLSGLTAGAAYWTGTARGWVPGLNDYLSLNVFGYWCLLLGGALFLLGREALRCFAFPMFFLVFIVPFPVVVANGLEIFFQHMSAQLAYFFIAATNTPMVHDGLTFRLPGITITVGQECSGIHSSLVLFITSLLAGHLFLTAGWKKAALAAFIVPLAIGRNAFRITTLAWLCAHDDPAWIDSALHHKGGPLFFALSLIPFFLLLLLLRKSEPAGAQVRA
jgi:exosortase C (VPDSG-CTERM-specific)